MKTDRLLLTECVLRKPTLFPLFDDLKHLLPYLGSLRMIYFFIMQNYMRLNLCARGGWPDGYGTNTFDKMVAY
jgi:hypothetical protein